MKGDYYRYLAEFKTGEDRQGVIADALTSYKAVKARAARLFCTLLRRVAFAIMHVFMG
jgi:hypothetical protein